MTDPVDLIFRTVAVTAASLLATLLLATRHGRPAAVPGALLCFATAAFFMTSAAGSAATLGAWRYPLTALCVTKAVWFWLLTRGLFIDGARITRPQLASVAIVAIAGLWQQHVFLPLYRAGNASALQSVAGFCFEGLLLSFIVLGLLNAWRDLAVDLVERRRRLRIGLLVLTGAYLAATLLVQLHNLLLGVSTSAEAAYANMLLVAGACLIAMKVGYGSIGAFNRAFKSRTGMTPTAYRRDHANGAPHAR